MIRHMRVVQSPVTSGVHPAMAVRAHGRNPARMVRAAVSPALDVMRFEVGMTVLSLVVRAAIMLCAPAGVWH